MPKAGPDLQARTTHFDLQANEFGVGAAQATGAGDTFELIVTARRADGSIDSDFTGIVHFTSSDGAAELPGDASLDQTGQLLPIILHLTNGQAAFPTILRTQGTQTITVNQVSRPNVTGTASIHVGRAGHTVVWSPHAIYPDGHTIIIGDGISWSQTMNWNVDRLPTSDDDVFLGSAPVKIRNLASGASVVFSGSAGLTLDTGSSLSIANDSTFNTLIVEGGSLTSSASVTVNEGLYWRDGTINLPGSGSLNANGGFYLYGEGTKDFPHGQINFTGNASYTGGTISGGGPNASIITQTGGQWDVSGSALIYNSKFNFNGGSNTGALALSDAALVIGAGSAGAATFSTRRSCTISGEIAPAQTVLVQSSGNATATLTAATDFTNAGTLTLQTIDNAGDSQFVVTSGTLTNAASGVINFNTGTGGYRRLSGNVTNNGTFNVNIDGALSKANGLFLNNATVNIEPGADLVFDMTSVFTQATGTLAIKSGKAGVSVDGTFVMDSDTFNFNGGTITGIPVLSDSALVIGPSSTGAATFSTRRASTISGNIAAAQTVLVQSSGNAGATLTAANSFTNSGTIALQTLDNAGDSNLTVTAGTLTNANTGVINVNTGSGGYHYIDANITNNGTVNFNADGALSKTNGLFTNNSQVNIADGADVVFGVTVSFTQSAGKLAINGSGTFVMDSDTFNFNGGTITGVPVLSDSMLAIGPSSTGAGTVSFRRASSLSGNIAAGQTLLVQSTGNAGATLTASTDFTNSGTITLQTLDNSGDSNLTVSAGTLTNAANGVININPGSAGNHFIDANITNNGTVNFNADGALSKTNGLFTNNSLVNIADGADVGFGVTGSFTQAAGKLAINGAGTFVMDNDTFNLNGGTITGVPVLSDSKLAIGPSSTATGTVSFRRASTLSGNIAAGQTLLVQSTGNAGATLTAVADFTNSGTITLQTLDNSGDSNLTVSAGTLTNAANGVININPGSAGNHFIDANITNNGTVNFNADGALSKTNGLFTNNSLVNIADGADVGFGVTGSFTQAAGKLAINGAGTFVMDNDTFNLNGGTITGVPVLSDSKLVTSPSSTGTGAVSTRRASTLSGNIAAGQTVLVQSSSNATATLTAANSFTNSGTITLQTLDNAGDSNLVVTSGTLTNALSGIVNLNPGSAGYRTLAAELVNNGTLNVATSSTLGRDGAHHVNAGTINVTGGELFVNQTGTTPTFTNNGTISISPAQALTISGGALTNFNAGTLSNGTYNIGGTFRFPDADIKTNSANVTLSGPSAQILNQSNSNALTNFASNNAKASFSVLGGANLTTQAGATEFLNAGGLTVGTSTSFTIASAKKFTQTGGTTTVNGLLATTNAIGVDLQGGILQGSGDIGGNLQNNGTINPGGTPGTLDVTGNFVQKSQGVLNIEVDDPTAHRLDTLNVTGTATLDGTLNLVRSNLASALPIAGVTIDVLFFASSTGNFVHTNGREVSTTLAYEAAFQPLKLSFVVGTPDTITANVVNGQLVITDIAGITDIITVTLDTVTNEFVITSVSPAGSTTVLRRGAAPVTGGLLVNLEDGNDRLDTTTLAVPVRAFGGPGRDTIRGGSNGDYFSGEDGDDSLEGFGGNDTLIGGAGNDTATGAGGTDSLVGDAGDDRLLGGGAVDTLEGGAGIDFLSGGASVAAISDQIEGTLVLTNTGYQTTRGDRALVDAGAGNQLGNVTLQGSDLADVIDISTFTGGRVTVMAGGGNDSVLGGAGPDVILGGDGDDTLLGGGGQDQVFGENGNDTVNGGGASDTVGGGLGNDRIVAGSAAGETNTLRKDVDANLTLSTSGGTHTLTGAGTDVLTGFIVAAQLTGGPSANTISAVNFSGATTLAGGDGNDTLLGSNQGDFLIGGAGADSLVGNSGNDSLFGDDDNDNLQGGVGNDVLHGGTGNDALDGGADIDRVVEQSNTDVVIVGLQLNSQLLGTDTATLVERIEITGGSGANVLDARQSSVQVLLNGGAGNDTLLGSAFPDDINGSSGNDVISGGGGNDTLDGSSGTDILYEVADTNFTINGLRLTSLATGDETALRVEGIVLVGGNGNNVLNASKSSVAVTLLGGSGNDTLTGSVFVDVLIGGSRADSTAGVDSINGDAGADIIGADAADTLVADPLDQVIADVLASLPTWIDAI